MLAGGDALGVRRNPEVAHRDMSLAVSLAELDGHDLVGDVLTVEVVAHRRVPVDRVDKVAVGLDLEVRAEHGPAGVRPSVRLVGGRL